MRAGPRDRVSRRQLVIGAGAAVLLGGCSGARAEPPADDAGILARALDLEHRLIGAYAAIGPARLRSAREVLEQEREHAEALARAIRGLGGRPARSPSARARGVGGGPAAVRLALVLEDRAVSLYMEALARLVDPELRATAAAILGSEAGHAAVLRSALGQEPVRSAFAATGTGAA